MSFLILPLGKYKRIRARVCIPMYMYMCMPREYRRISFLFRGDDIDEAVNVPSAASHAVFR